MGLTGTEEDFSVEALEERLALALSRIEGAGEVSVILTVDSGMERVLATDRTQEQADGGVSIQEETVILSTDAGEEAVLVTQRYPTFQGALVVCPGGDDPSVRLVLTQAVAALTGLGTDRSLAQAFSKLERDQSQRAYALICVHLDLDRVGCLRGQEQAEELKKN